MLMTLIIILDRKTNNIKLYIYCIPKIKKSKYRIILKKII